MRLPILAVGLVLGLQAFQPDPAAMRKLFEQALERREKAYGEADARTAQAGRDLGLFLCRSGDAQSARRAMARAVQLDEKAFGANAAQTLEDVATLAGISPRAEAEPLLQRAGESPDAMVAGPALTSLAEMRKATGDVRSAADLLRRALQKAEAADGPEGVTALLILKLLAQVLPPKEAVPVMQRALSIDVAKLGPTDKGSLQDARTLAALLRSIGEISQAAQVERQFKLPPGR
jgi:tetratricopeptide (TPR) repeat protein